MIGTIPTSAVVGKDETAVAPKVAPWDNDPVAEQPAQVAKTSGPWDQDPAVQPWDNDPVAETPLLSVKGASSLFKQIGPNIAIGVLGSELAELENIKRSRDEKRARGEAITSPGYTPEDDVRLEQQIVEKRRAIEEGKRNLTATSGQPSTPLRIAQGITQSIGQNAPGVALAVATRGAGGVGMVPAIQAAEQQSSGQAYAEARVPSDPNKRPAAVGDALIHADVSGKAEAVFELMPLGKLVQEVGKEGLSTLIRNYVFREWKTELPTTAAQDVSEWATIEKDMPFKEFMSKLGKDLVETAIITPFAAGGTAALAKGQTIVGQGFQKGELGPSGENMGPIMPHNQPQLPSVPSVPPPVPTTAPTQDVQSLIASIDATLSPDTITDDQVEAAKQQIAAFEKARLAPPREENITLLAGLDDLTPSQELGQSAKSMRNAPNYAPNPNDALPRSERVVSYSTVEGAQTGLTLTQTELKPGVYVVGEPSSDREGPILQAAADTLEQWRAKFLPDRPMLVVNETLPSANHTGWHWTNGKVHAITPAVLRQFIASGGPAQFNANAQPNFFYNLAHEFGHSLVEDRLFVEGLTPDLTMALKVESERGPVSEGTVAALEAVDPARAAVVREYNSIRERVLSGQMTALEFMAEWMGPAKAGRRKQLGPHDLNIPDTAPALQLIDKILQRAKGSKTPLPSEELHAARAAYLSLHEYGAEQVARYAYAKKWDQSSPFNKDSLFAQAFQSLRNALAEFFAFLKREGDVAPNTTFAEWLDGLTTAGDRTAKPGKKKAKAAVKPKVKAKTKPAVEELDHNVETVSEEKVKFYRSLVTGLVRNKTIDVGDDTYKHLMALLKSGDYSTFVDEIQPMLEKKVRFELDDVPDVKTVGLNTDPALLIQQFGANLYQGNVTGVIVKELVQNAFDAVKAQKNTIEEVPQGKSNDPFRQTPFYNAEIDIKIDQDERSVTVTDNGIGMTRDILEQSFLTYPGSSKIGLSPEESSGGLGLAKVVILFVPARVEVRTVRDGELTVMNATPDEIISRTAKATVTKTLEPNGTTVKVILPEVIERPTGVEKIEVLPYDWEYPVLSKGLIGNLTVKFNGFKDVATAPAFPLYKSMDFPWGEVELYVGEEEKSWGGTAAVYSSGLWQFNTELMMLNKETLPYDTALNIKPHVRAKEATYPFDNNRQSLRPHVLRDMSKVINELSELVIQRRLEKAVATYANLQALSPEGPVKIQITTTKDEKGRPQMEIQAAEDYPLWHNNTEVDWLAEFPDASRLFHKLGVAMIQIADRVRTLKPEQGLGAVLKAGLKGAAETPPPPPRHYAIGIDREFYGMNIKKPYNAIFLNPLPGQAKTLEGVSEELYQTIMHEIAHNYVWSHNDVFADELAKVQVIVADNGLRSAFYNMIREFLKPHFDLYLQMRERFNDPSTKNSGPSVEGQQRFDLAKFSDNATDRDGGAGPESRAGAAIARSRRGTGDIHYELDGLGNETGFGVPAVGITAGLPEHAARRPDILADAQAKWKQLGFRSPYFKAWFGDWEAGEASQVVALANENQVPGVQGPAGEYPLTVFHASVAKVQTPRGWEPFVAFNDGDIGFHFGTLRAAHNRGYGGLLEVPDFPNLRNSDFEYITGRFTENTEFVGGLRDAYIIPAVLNIRNPIIFGEENTGMWVSPRAMLAQMAVEGVSPFSLQEANQIWQETEQILLGPKVVSKFEQFRPLREALLAKGFDGMQYINTQEGDISWVAFKPEQVKSLLGNKTFSQSADMHWELDFDEAQPDGYSAARYRDKLGKWMPNPGAFRRALRHVTNLQFKTLQLQQLAHLHPDLTHLAYMNERNYEYNRYKGSLQAAPDKVLAEWSELGKENFSRVNKFLQMEAEGGQLWFELVKEPQGWFYQPNATTLEKLKQFGIDPATPEGEALGALIINAKNALLHQVNEGEKVLMHLLSRRYSDHATLMAAITPLRREIHEVRKRPFFPQGRFGNYVLTIEKKRDAAPGYEVVYREAFESREEWMAAWEKAGKAVKPDERVRKFELTDTEYVMMSLPQDFIELAVSELGLTDEQRDTLINITQPVRREKVLRSYDLHRLGVKGASADAMRSFANFTWHNANLLAKLRYRSEFNMAIQGIASQLREAQYSPDPASLTEVDRLTRVKRYMERSRDFIMAPPNEAHMARAFVSIAYLGFNVKTALVNFYGLATTWSDVTSRLGQVEGNKVFMNALRGTWASVKLSDLNAVRANKALSPELQAGLDRAVQEGVLTQSYAYHLAGMANASNLYRMPSRQLLGKMTHKAVDLAMWTFRVAELGARRATFIAELEIAMRQPGRGFTDAYTEAVTATNKLQNDYSLGNRVPFMRGIKTTSGNPLIEAAVPMATIFMSFAQHMAFHSYGGYELGQRRADLREGRTPRSVVGGYTMKIWLLTLLLAGYEGLPGAENLLDLLDALWKKIGGGKPARQEMREMVRELGVDPVWAARGLGHNVAGFDVSRSLGFGRLVPGTDVLAKTSTDLDRTVGGMVFDLAGPTGNMLHWMLNTSFGAKPMAEGMKRAPGALGNVFNAYSWSQHGVRAPSGAEITFDLETKAPRDLTTFEIMGKALGFNPTIVSQNREILFKQHDARMYWISRRDRLLDDIWRATWQNDREAIADTKKAIIDFNNEIPDEYKRSFRISARDIFESRRNRARTKRLEERQLPGQRRYRELYRDIRESFGESDPVAQP